MHKFRIWWLVETSRVTSWRCEASLQAKFTTWKPVNMKYLLYLKNFSRRERLLLMLSVDRAETLLILSHKCLKFWICWVVCLAMQGLSFIVRSILMYTVHFGASKSRVVRGNKQFLYRNANKIPVCRLSRKTSAHLTHLTLWPLAALVSAFKIQFLNRSLLSFLAVFASAASERWITTAPGWITVWGRKIRDSLFCLRWVSSWILVWTYLKTNWCCKWCR